MKRLCFAVLSLGLLLVLAACGSSSVATIKPAWAGEIEVSKTVETSLERRIEYDWTVEKSVTPTSATIPKGASASFDYTLEVDRLEGVVRDVFGVAGVISVKNMGGESIDATITDIVEYQDAEGDWHELSRVVFTHVTLDVGTTQQDYSVDFEKPEQAIAYRNRAEVVLSTGEGPSPDPGYEDFAAVVPFSLPDSPTSSKVWDAEAELTDLMDDCPEGFRCEGHENGPWTFTESGSISYTVEVTNDSADCGKTVELKNTATLTESDSQEQHDDSVTVPIITGECEDDNGEEEGGQGCTPGYWRQPHHYDAWMLTIDGTSYGPGDSFETVFGVDIDIKAKTGRRGPPSTNGDPSLAEAVEALGGGQSALARHAVAAVLNAAHPDVSYAYTTEEVIAIVQEAFATGDFEAAKNLLATQNEMGCPLN